MEPLFDPADFRIPPGVAHVCAAGETPFLRRHDAAFLAYAEDKSGGSPGRTRQEAMLASARGRAARLFGVAAGDIGFVSSVAEGGVDGGREHRLAARRRGAGRSG
jgi:cysteine desulfurase/selenocysteine lyase